jgi:ketosteroid isomerase-like protein
MKAIKSLVLIILLGAISLASTNVITIADDIRKELEAVYAKIDEAIKDKDLKTLESLLSEDYEKQAEGKTIKRPEAIAQMKKSLEAVKTVESVKTTIDKIKQVEGNQIVDYTQTAKVKITDENGKDQSVVITTKGRDWWVKDDDGEWICVSAERIE